ncbi:MAG TPA: S8 family serine peptidase, partial [Thermoanaerobaculia bacterium]|nr:S8 family serine peptidase [Thermoanaerobaculia bacterium]
PFNTGSRNGGLDWENVNPARRKIIAYDFLYSCDQYPGAQGCDTPGAVGSLDNQGHGTHAAATAAGDRGAPLAHDYADAIAPGAKLIIQDAGYIGGDLCSQRPGIGCPVKLTPILEQAYKQGARIHSNSWGDRQGSASLNPPTANYPQSARDVDAFVYAHPDLLVVFNTGNLGAVGPTPQSSLSAPGSAKNTLQIGGTRTGSEDDDVIAAFTLFGPTRDGRIKPDLVAPARVLAGDIDFDNRASTCDVSYQSGTSWSAPSVAGAAALVRQYYTDGFYPSGAATLANQFTPSAALLKATLIAAARPVPWRRNIINNQTVEALPAPSYEQGWGFPVLDDALYFPGDARKLIVDNGELASNESKTLRVNVRAGTPFKAVLVWTDPPGVVRSVSDPTPQLVNDLDLRVNGVSNDDHLNNVEVIAIGEPSMGVSTITISAPSLGVGPRQSYALVITGDVSLVPLRTRSVRH